MKKYLPQYLLTGVQKGFVSTKNAESVDVEACGAHFDSESCVDENFTVFLTLSNKERYVVGILFDKNKEVAREKAMKFAEQIAIDLFSSE